MIVKIYTTDECPVLIDIQAPSGTIERHGREFSLSDFEWCESLEKDVPVYREIVHGSETLSSRSVSRTS